MNILEEKGELNRKILRYLLVTVLLLTGVFTSSIRTNCVGSTKIYVNPPEVKDLTLGPGKSFTINVCIANVSNMANYEFNMSYDIAMLTCTGVTVGPTANLPAASFEINNYRGNVWVKVTYGVPVTTNPAVTVASLTFWVQGRGSSALDLYYTNLTNSLGQLIPHDVSDGYFYNSSPYDVNEDGHIDITDIVIVARAFGKEEGDPGWDPRADVYPEGGNGVIDIFDLVSVATHYGEF